MAMADENTQALHERFELLKGAEHHKNSLIEVSATFACPQRSQYHTNQKIYELQKSAPLREALKC